MNKKIIYLTAFGETLSIYAWAKKLKMPGSTIWKRYKDGWDPEIILSTPIKVYAVYEAFGLKKSLEDWSRLSGIPRETLSYRISGQKMNIEQALEVGKFQPKLYEAFGQLKTVPEWAEEYNIEKSTLYSRIQRKKLTMQQALEYVNNTPHGKNNRSRMLTVFGKTQPIHKWAIEYGLQSHTVRARIDKLKWPPEQALTIPKLKKREK